MGREIEADIKDSYIRTRAVSLKMCTLFVPGTWGIT